MIKKLKLSDIVPTGKKLTLIIGSGFNRHILSDDNSILCDWKSLLEAIFPNEKILLNNYILEFERLLVKVTARQKKSAAQKMQSSILKDLKEKFVNKEKKVIADKKLKLPEYLFNSRIISDVVSLNFDLLPEKHLETGGLKGLRSKKIENINDNSQRFRVVNNIRFWHPHGDIQHRDSIILGMRQYARHLKSVEHMRVRFRAKKNKSNAKIDTWYEALLHNPLMIIGASLSESEWDIWTALVNRERNFARGTSKNNRKAVYIMQSNCNKQSAVNRPDWFEPIFDVNFCYPRQWELLENMFKADVRSISKT